MQVRSFKTSFNTNISEIKKTWETDMTELSLVLPLLLRKNKSELRIYFFFLIFPF